MRLSSRGALDEFNRRMPCGMKLLRMRRGTSAFVVGTFELTERPKGQTCGLSVGETTVVAFEIRDRHITRWMQDAASVATPTGG